MFKTILSIFVVSTIAMFVISEVKAAGKGGIPNGKPFVELNGYIHEIEGEVSSIQDQIATIAGEVDTMEGQLANYEQAITDLYSQSSNLQTQIDANATDITSLETQISDLEAANEDLQAQIDASGDVDGQLQGQIDANSVLITNITLSLDVINSSLQQQIDNNATLISAIESEIAQINQFLALKQDIINGQCPNGQFLRAINPDGSIVCGQDNTGISGSYLDVTTTWIGWYGVPGGHYDTRVHYCPSGWIATSMGFYGWDGWIHPTRLTTHGNHGAVQVANHCSCYRWFVANLTCARVVNQ